MISKLKKRCSRCHAKIDSFQRTCPYCGTMVRRPRGNVKVAKEVMPGVLPEPSSMSPTTLKHILAAAAAVVLLCIFGAMLGCGSCEGCGGCAVRSSCASCSSCGSCNACASCGSCAECGSGEGCASCKDAGIEYKDSLNGANFCREYYLDGTLYYVDGDTLKALRDGSDAVVLASGKGMNCVYADENYVYYLQSGNVWRSPIEKPLTVDGEPAADYASERVLNATVSGSDLGVVNISGYSLLQDGSMCYWGATAGGSTAICVSGDNAVTGNTLYVGGYSNVQCYRGGVFFVSREEETKGHVLRVDLESGEVADITQKTANYYALCDGAVYACYVAEDKTSELVRISIADGEIEGKWQFYNISGMIANDSWLYYYINDSGKGSVYRLDPQCKEHKLVFESASRIMLYGLAGNYFSVYTNMGSTADDRYTAANYYIFNADSRAQIDVVK